MNTGWIKLHRRILESAVFADAELLRLWVWLLAKVTSKRRHVSLRTGRGEAIVTLEAGQCVVGRVRSAAELGWKGSTFRDRLARLVRLGMVSVTPDTHWSIVSITNWERFQRMEKDSTTPNRQANDNQVTTNRQANDTNKKDKKYEKDENRRRFAPPTLDEVTNYCRERGNQVDPQRFLDFYTANGWIQGKGKPIRDWKAAVRTWEANATTGQARPEPPRKLLQPMLNAAEVAE